MGLVDGEAMQDGDENTAESTGFTADMLNDFMAGEDIFQGFLEHWRINRTNRNLCNRWNYIEDFFSEDMDLISKSERIDGKTLLAPKSLGWMMGFLIFSEMMSWLQNNSQPVWDTNADNAIEWSFTFFLLGMLLAAYRLVDYLDAFIVVEGEENAASRRSLASVAESVGHLVVALLAAFVVAGLFGLNLNGLIAGLGITGLALALAARDSVANIRGYFDNYRPTIQCWRLDSS